MAGLFVAGIVVVIGILIGITYLAKLFWGEGAVEILVALFLCCCILPVSFQLWRKIKKLERDRGKVRRYEFSATKERGVIVEELGALQTSHGRQLYLEQILLHGIMAVGDWPPQFKMLDLQGRNKSLLAQLEAKWLGIDA